MSQLSTDILPLATDTESPRAVTLRSLLTGTLAVIVVCAITPFNDIVLSDTSLSAGFLPVAAVLVMFLLCVGINAPLRKWAPKFAYSSRELAVVLLMTLVACALPNWGMARFFTPMPVAPFHVGASDPAFWKSFTAMGLPHWLFPVPDIASGRTSDEATWFFFRTPMGSHIPFGSWIVPLAAWGVFMLAMLATLAAMARLVIEQWTVNERLAFPLLQVQTALIDPAKPGYAFNELFRKRALWIGMIGVFLIHSLTGLNTYYPKFFPKIPLSYDFSAIFADPPMSFLDEKVKKAALSFMIIGAAYFIRSRVSFSLWATFLIIGLFRMQTRMRQGEVPDSSFADQHLGASIVFAGSIFWVGREHWMRVVRNAFGRGTDASYRGAFWTVVIGIIVMVGWLLVVGVQAWIAVLIVLFILVAHLVVSRILAETGLPFFRSGISIAQVYTNVPISWFNPRDVFFSCVYTILGPLTSRDSLMGHTMHGLGAIRQTGVDAGERWKIGGAIAWAILLGAVVAVGMTLYCQYSYPTPPTETSVPQGNYFGADYIPRRDLANPFNAYSTGRYPPKPNNPALHIAIGAVITLGLQLASMRWGAWPFLPVGFIAAYGAFLANAWFSVFIGWLAKVITVRVGGAKMLEAAKPFFIGLIIGESLAAGAWIIVNAVVVLSGGQSLTVKILL